MLECCNALQQLHVALLQGTAHCFRRWNTASEEVVVHGSTPTCPTLKQALSQNIEVLPGTATSSEWGMLPSAQVPEPLQPSDGKVRYKVPHLQLKVVHKCCAHVLVSVAK
jgi:hypothetical protein